MTKDGKLSARERDTLLRARRILDAWIERQEAAGKTSDNSFPVHDAYEAIYFLDEFAYQTRVSDMNDFYEDFHRRQYERYMRREARKQWEADRPKRVIENIITALGYIALGIFFYLYLFVGALWASM